MVRHVETLKSRFSRDRTLTERRTEVLGAAEAVQIQLESARAEPVEQLTRTLALLLDRDAPTQLIVELVDGRITQVVEGS